jgi:hypothetical protein
MIARVTDADRATARELELLIRSGTGGRDLREQVIARALADVRQPFLDLADRLETQRPELELPRGHVADMIRSVARNAP